MLQPAAFTHVLDVVETAAGVAYSMSPCPRLFRTTAWTRPRLEGPLCKATSKLAEALAWVKHAPRGGVAIDLGERCHAASPGVCQAAIWFSCRHCLHPTLLCDRSTPGVSREYRLIRVHLPFYAV